MKRDDSHAARFNQETAEHVMTVLRDNGVDRHLRFRKPGTYCMGFDLITWSGSLCIHGDCGTYVFSRLEDMFEFFRSPTGRINAQYWAEKVDAQDKHGAIECWSPQKFRAAVVRNFREYWRDGDKVEQLACFRELREQVLDHYGEEPHESMCAVRDFESHGFQFHDFWDNRLTEYTFRFLWCLRAIVLGIQIHDASKQQAEAA